MRVPPPFPLTLEPAFRMIPLRRQTRRQRPRRNFMEEERWYARVRANHRSHRCAWKRPRLTHLACLIGLAALALFPGWAARPGLTYHEAFVAQGAREILDSGQWLYPTIGGLPWLEKPPLPWWLAAAFGRFAGGIDETVARLPSALAAIGLVLGVAVLAARHYGRTISLLAGAVQATTAWTVLRGRLAEADVLLACMIVWSIVAFDEMLAAAGQGPEPRRILHRDGTVRGGCSSASWARRRSSRESVSAP